MAADGLCCGALSPVVQQTEIPVVLDRISTPVPERVGHYQSMLGWSLTNFSADSLRPYRDKMVTVVEAQADWPSNGVLTRLAELGARSLFSDSVARMQWRP